MRDPKDLGLANYANFYGRKFVPNKAAHVLEVQNADGIFTYYQFIPNSVKDDPDHIFRPVILEEGKFNQEQIDMECGSNNDPSTPLSQSKFKIKAFTPDGRTELTSARSVQIKLLEEIQEELSASTPKKDSFLLSAQFSVDGKKSIATTLHFLSPLERKDGGENARVHKPRDKKKQKNTQLQLTQCKNQSKQLNTLAGQENLSKDQLPQKGQKRKLDLENPQDVEYSGFGQNIHKKPKGISPKALVFSDLTSKRNGVLNEEDSPHQEYEKLDKPSLKAPSQSQTVETKGGKEVTLTGVRGNRKSARSQKQVAGMTAKESLLKTIQSNAHRFQAEILKLMISFVENFALEWLHCLAFSLSPQSFNPQTMTNLAVGTKWINTQMMVLESVAKHFVIRYPGAVSVIPTFNMLLDTDIVEKIEYVVKIQKDNREVMIHDSIKALALPNRSNYPSVTDSIQTIRVVDCLLSAESMKQNGMTVLTTRFPGKKP